MAVEGSYCLAIDVGTASVRAAVVSSDTGRISSHATRKVDL
jgi:sugar (pentulose or hexulose) kinase